MAFELTDEQRIGAGLNPRLTLGEFRAVTRDLPDDTPLVTAGMDEYGIADACTGTVRIVSRDWLGRDATGAVYAVDDDAGELAVFVDLNNQRWWDGGTFRPRGE